MDLDSVCCIKAEAHYSNLYTDDEVYLCNLSLSDLEGRLDDRISFRLHRSYIVNMRYAKAFEKTDDQCNLVLDHKDGLSIPISRSNVGKVRKLLGLD